MSQLGDGDHGDQSSQGPRPAKRRFDWRAFWTTAGIFAAIAVVSSLVLHFLWPGGPRPWPTVTGMGLVSAIMAGLGSPQRKADDQSG